MKKKEGRNDGRTEHKKGTVGRKGRKERAGRKETNGKEGRKYVRKKLRERRKV